MADVFLSYAKEDRLRAERLVAAVRQSGWSVWWDADLAPGERYRDAIHRELNTARCVVVLWSTTSVRSDYVLDEAGEAMGRRVLVQAIVDDVLPPFGFRQLQFANLVGWDGSNEHPGCDDLRRGITRHVQPSGTGTIHGNYRLSPVIQGASGTPPDAHAPNPIIRLRNRSVVLAMGLLAIAVTVGAGVWLANRPSEETPQLPPSQSSPLPGSSSRSTKPWPETVRARLGDEVRVYIGTLPAKIVPRADEIFLQQGEAWRRLVPSIPAIRRVGESEEADVEIATYGGDMTFKFDPPLPGSKEPAQMLFREYVMWTEKNYSAASARMWGYILGLQETTTPGQLMTKGVLPSSFPPHPQAEDIARARAIWGTEARN